MTTSVIASLNNRIRPMGLDRMCYDCRMVNMIAVSMMCAITARDEGRVLVRELRLQHHYRRVQVRGSDLAHQRDDVPRQQHNHAAGEVLHLPVYMWSKDSIDIASVSISPVKLDELVQMYETIYTFTHTIWHNLPTLPDCESAVVIIWMIAAEDYEINHFTGEMGRQVGEHLCIIVVDDRQAQDQHRRQDHLLAHSIKGSHKVRRVHRHAQSGRNVPVPEGNHYFAPHRGFVAGDGAVYYHRLDRRVRVLLRLQAVDDAAEEVWDHGRLGDEDEELPAHQSENSRLQLAGNERLLPHLSLHLPDQLPALVDIPAVEYLRALHDDHELVDRVEFGAAVQSVPNVGVQGLLLQPRAKPLDTGGVISILVSPGIANVQPLVVSTTNVWSMAVINLEIGCDIDSGTISAAENMLSITDIDAIPSEFFLRFIQELG
ncbi:hypothetical protein QQS21_011017 [Conoideocrella luteorostrata]|uniref:Uncharacterized protein n=1 Tax=Conoideocrella luteorostrata TaxID=1105319 RepID=A0AAJ0FTP3_9HYPO|nr:hypothetical protein QQS21_011017 [Conoideocrella luteorostrata]